MIYVTVTNISITTLLIISSWTVYVCPAILNNITKYPYIIPLRLSSSLLPPGNEFGLWDRRLLEEKNNEEHSNADKTIANNNNNDENSNENGKNKINNDHYDDKNISTNSLNDCRNIDVCIEVIHLPIQNTHNNIQCDGNQNEDSDSKNSKNTSNGHAYDDIVVSSIEKNRSIGLDGKVRLKVGCKQTDM